MVSQPLLGFLFVNTQLEAFILIVNEYAHHELQERFKYGYVLRRRRVNSTLDHTLHDHLQRILFIILIQFLSKLGRDHNSLWFFNLDGAFRGRFGWCFSIRFLWPCQHFFLYLQDPGFAVVNLPLLRLLSFFSGFFEYIYHLESSDVDFGNHPLIKVLAPWENKVLVESHRCVGKELNLFWLYIFDFLFVVHHREPINQFLVIYKREQSFVPECVWDSLKLICGEPVYKLLMVRSHQVSAMIQHFLPI